MAQIREFESTTESYFILDGVKYPKSYEAVDDSSLNNNRLKVIPIGRTGEQLVFSTHYRNVSVNGSRFNSLEEAISAINEVVFSKGGGSGDGGTTEAAENANNAAAAANQAAQNALSGIKGVATTSTVPSATIFERYIVHTAGTYTNFGGIVVTAADLDVVNGVANNRVILEVSEGVATKRVERVKGDALILKTAFEPANNIDASTMAAVNDWFSTVAPDGYAEPENPLYKPGIYSDSAVYSNYTGYLSTDLISLTGVNKVRLENFNPPTNDYAIKFFDASNVKVLDLKQKGSFDITIPATADKFIITLPSASATGVRVRTFKYEVRPFDKGTSSKVVTTLSEKFKPVNSVGVTDFVKSSLTDKISELNPDVTSVYRARVGDYKIDIDSFTGTDDQRIDKALAMINNVGGGQLYFPNRTVNITKAILIPSNSKIILDNTAIQMADNIHDNIFRPQGLVIDPANPKGKCLSASWTENFEIIGIGTPTVRQSVTPLYTGDTWGWRGISIVFARCRFYKVSNIKVIESHMWSISNEYSENGEFENISFQNTLHPNADGINFRNGCRNMYVKIVRGVTNDNAIAVTNLDTVQSFAGNRFYQALGNKWGDYWGAENIVVEDVQVKAKYGVGLILGTSNIVKNITYRDFISTVPTLGSDWDNVAVCGNQYRTYVYGNSYVAGNVRNINVINSKTSIHEYSLGVYGGVINDLYVTGIENTKPGKLGDIKNDTGTVIHS